jgi:hypothetical protein
LDVEDLGWYSVAAAADFSATCRTSVATRSQGHTRSYPALAGLPFGRAAVVSLRRISLNFEMNKMA